MTWQPFKPFGTPFHDALQREKERQRVERLFPTCAKCNKKVDELVAACRFDEALDAQIVELYHRSMDARPTGGDSRTGRHLLTELQKMGVRILAAGSSDWVVLAQDGKYPADEGYFLKFILHFFGERGRRWIQIL